MKERGSKSEKFNPIRGLAIGLLSLALITGCSKPVVHGFEIDPKSACNSRPITIEITPETKKIILFGEEFTVNQGIIEGFGVNPDTGLLEKKGKDINGDGNPDTIKASVAGNQITARLVCGTEQNPESNK